MIPLEYVHMAADGCRGQFQGAGQTLYRVSPVPLKGRQDLKASSYHDIVSLLRASKEANVFLLQRSSIWSKCQLGGLTCNMAGKDS